MKILYIVAVIILYLALLRVVVVLHQKRGNKNAESEAYHITLFAVVLATIVGILFFGSLLG